MAKARRETTRRPCRYATLECVCHTFGAISNDLKKKGCGRACFLNALRARAMPAPVLLSNCHWRLSCLAAAACRFPRKRKLTLFLCVSVSPSHRLTLQNDRDVVASAIEESLAMSHRSQENRTDVIEINASAAFGESQACDWPIENSVSSASRERRFSCESAN